MSREPGGAVEPVRRAYGEHPCQYGEFYPAAHGRGPGQPGAGAVAVLHGGFWRAHRGVEMTAPLCAHLARQGRHVWNVEYRRAGQGDWRATLDDCAAGIAHLAVLAEEFGFAGALAHTAVVGHSAGGQLAVWAAGGDVRAAARPLRESVRIREVVSLAGVLDLGHAARTHVGEDAVRQFLGGGPDDRPERYELADPARRPPPAATVHCVHGEADERVPFELSERYVRAAARAGGDVRLIRVPGRHTDPIDPGSPAWRAAARRIGVLRPADPAGRPSDRPPTE